MWNKRVWGVIVVAVLLAFCTAVGGTSAFMMSKDAKVNSFEVGEVKISVLEPAWEEGTAASALEPGQLIDKDPVIKNIGVNDAFVFMVLDLPKIMGVMLFDENGNLKRTSQSQGTVLFEPQLTIGYDEYWVKIDETNLNNPDTEYLRQVWAYAGSQGDNDLGTAAVPQGNSFAMKLLAPGESTLPLFEAVRYVRAVEGQGLTDKRFNLEVYGYAIQAENLGTENPAEVWDILYGQIGR